MVKIHSRQYVPIEADHRMIQLIGYLQDMLPQNVGDLTDDAYRSLAWAVKSRKGFKATSIPFAEFIWAGTVTPSIEQSRSMYLILFLFVSRLSPSDVEQRA